MTHPILKKFSVKNKYIFSLFLSNFLFSQTCIDNWVTNNPTFNDNYFIIRAVANNENIKLFYDYSGKIRFESNNSIIISNSNHTSKYYIDSEELYIDNSDKVFNEKIISLVNVNKLKKNIKLNSNNTYVFKNKLKFGKTKLYFNDNCAKLDSIIIYKNEYKIKIHDIVLDTLSIDSINNLFSFDFENEELKIYDFRTQK